MVDFDPYGEPRAYDMHPPPCDSPHDKLPNCFCSQIHNPHCLEPTSRSPGSPRWMFSTPTHAIAIMTARSDPLLSGTLNAGSGRTVTGWSKLCSIVSIFTLIFLFLFLFYLISPISTTPPSPSPTVDIIFRRRRPCPHRLVGSWGMDGA